MEWYVRRLEELEKAEPIYSICGDDCAVCPRFIARTDEELHETAVFWHRAGWRDHVVTNDEIKCAGCGSRPSCSFMLLPCAKEHGVTVCRECAGFPCGKVRHALDSSEQKKQGCRRACQCDEEFAMFVRAFYEKEKNMGL